MMMTTTTKATPPTPLIGTSSSSSLTTTQGRALGRVLPRRRTKRRATSLRRGKVAKVTFVVRAAEEEQDGEEEDKATYKETFDTSTGQMVKTLTQSIEQIDVNGQTWTQRRGSPSGGKNKENKKENAVVFIHGLGSRAVSYTHLTLPTILLV